VRQTRESMAVMEVTSTTGEVWSTTHAALRDRAVRDESVPAARGRFQKDRRLRRQIVVAGPTDTPARRFPVAIVRALVIENAPAGERHVHPVRSYRAAVFLETQRTEKPNALRLRQSFDVNVIRAWPGHGFRWAATFAPGCLVALNNFPRFRFFFVANELGREFAQPHSTTRPRPRRLPARAPAADPGSPR
jgi:hypothetical protein